MTSSGLELWRHTRAGAFVDVVGRRAALFGYEHRPFEAWVYPLKIADDLTFSFRLEGYPLDIAAADILTGITVRPEATILTYAHAAFTVRQIMFAPIDEPGVVILLDVDTTLPMTITGSLRPRLRLMWPAGLMTPWVSWDAQASSYLIGEESGRFAGVIGSPGARDVSVMPYQEEPRDQPVQFVIPADLADLRSSFVPIVISGSVEGRDAARRAYARILGSVEPLYRATTEHYRRVLNDTLRIETPDARVNQAFVWAKVGADKGFGTNPALGTGLLAGFRTSGDSERPGFAWFFGRDSMWTVLALTSYGDVAGARTALEFLRKFQRQDGKIPHEISQSASYIPWFTDYSYAWASADSTPLYVIAQADYWRATGDLAFIKAAWPSILKAYRFVAATDTDGNGLIENTKVGHGWVEGGALYPAHEEIYLQGTWIEALGGLAEIADALGESRVAADAGAAADRTRQAVERTYWIDAKRMYAFATALPRETAVAEPGPARERRQARLDVLKRARLVDEDTVLTAVPLWWRVLDPQRAQDAIDRLGAGALATDWGHRLLSAHSELYDPLSYHYGSVWPLFTGWAAVGAYRYGRPHVGLQAVMANALLFDQGALGYVTELLSGDYNVVFGRSSHHQIWSEAMVVTPIVRGLLGIEAERGGRALRIEPQLPADWPRVVARGVVVGENKVDVEIERRTGSTRVGADLGRPERGLGKPGPYQPIRLIIAPAFPLDAEIRRVTIDGRAVKIERERIGDVQRARVEIDLTAPRAEVVFEHTAGTDVYVTRETPRPGATNSGLRVLRSRADRLALRLLLEGLGGRTYAMRVRSSRAPTEAAGGTLEPGAGDPKLTVSFEGAGYVRKEVSVGLR